MNRMTKRLARIESAWDVGNDRNAVGRLIGISVPHGTDTDAALADLGMVPEPGDAVIAFVGLAPGADGQMSRITSPSRGSFSSTSIGRPVSRSMPRVTVMCS